MKWIFIAILLAGAGAFGFWYYHQPHEKKVEYKTATVTRGDVVQAVTANGQLTPVQNVAVGSQISGNIKEIKADFNSRVSAGDVIAQIDPATYEQSVDQAEAELANAKAALELAELNYKRAKQLRENQLISESESEKTVADFHQAQAVVRMREASVKKSKVDLERTTIYAPISGIVISRNIDVGQTVAASFSTPTLFQIANDLAKMEIDAMVSEADVGGVEEKQRVEFTVEAFPGRQFQGIVRQVRYAPTTNQNVVTYTTVVQVNNDDLKLRPGMTATASIITAQRTNVIKVPNAALRFRPPEDATAKGTNGASKKGSTNQSAGAVAQAGGESRLAAAGSGERLSPEERRRRFENMTPEQQQAMRERMRARFGEGGPPGGGDGRAPRRAEPSTRTIYILSKTNSVAAREFPALQRVTVKLGISDGNHTEVLDGLTEGDEVITGINSPAGTATAAARPGSSPLGGPFGGGGFRPR